LILGADSVTLLPSVLATVLLRLTFVLGVVVFFVITVNLSFADSAHNAPTVAAKLPLVVASGRKPGD
jgi:preprotein translocase subunit SecG